jgi:hypothetical protein
MNKPWITANSSEVSSLADGILEGLVGASLSGRIESGAGC